MTPERLQEIRDYANNPDWNDPYNLDSADQAYQDRRDLLAHIDTLHAQIAALRRGQGPAPAPREPGPITVTPIPDSRRTS